jgi:hypothetical protein
MNKKIKALIPLLAILTMSVTSLGTIIAIIGLGLPSWWLLPVNFIILTLAIVVILRWAE